MPHCPHCKEEVSPRDLVYEDNSFRKKPESTQTDLTELGGGKSSGPSDESVWDMVELDVEDLSQLSAKSEPTLELGQGWNEEDPHEW